MIESGANTYKYIPTERKQGPTIPLSDQEREILVLSGRGFLYEEVADRLGLPPLNVKKHLSGINGKLLEGSTHDALARTLLTEEIPVEEVMPQEYDVSLIEDLVRSDKLTRAWGVLAEHVGTIPQIALRLKIGGPTLKNDSIKVYFALGVGSRIEATVLYYGARAAGLIPES